jgi:hypothetical protein
LCVGGGVGDAGTVVGVTVGTAVTPDTASGSSPGPIRNECLLLGAGTEIGTSFLAATGATLGVRTHVATAGFPGLSIAAYL